MFFEKIKNGHNEWWRYLIGGVLIFFGWQTIAMLPVAVIYGYVLAQGGSISMSPAKTFASAGLSKNTALFTVLLTFVLACVILFFIVKYLHKQKFLTLLTARSKFSWKRAFYGFGVWLTVALISLGISYKLTPEDFVFSFDLMTFLPLLIISIFILPFQTSFEEFYFRGYLTQGVGLVTGSRIWAILLPGIVFGLLHSFNPEVFAHGFWIMMPFYIGMGVFLGILAVMDDGLEIPLGIHFANNFTGSVLVSVKSSALPTTPLFTLTNYDPMDEIFSSVFIMIIFLVISSLIFKWKWKKLFRKI